MSRIKTAMLGMVALGAIASTPLFAASTTHNVNVSATVQGNCRFNTAGPTSLVIANSGAVIDPTLTGAATGSATVAFRCTSGTASAISADNGLHFSGSRRVNDGGTGFMPYGLTLTGDVQTGTGHGAGNDLTLTVDASIAEADYAAAAAGTYTDTVVLTITP